MATEHICPGKGWVEGTVAHCARHNKSGVPVSSPGLLRLKKENASGISSKEMEQSIIREAKKDGRDLHRPSDFGW